MARGGSPPSGRRRGSSRSHSIPNANERAVAAGATEIYPVAEQHGWRLGRIEDPFGHHWEIGKPLVVWPPVEGEHGP